MRHFDSKGRPQSRSRSLHCEQLEPRYCLSGDAPFTPVLELQVTDGVTYDVANGAVTSWADSSSNGNSLLSSGARRPTYGAVLTPSGIATITFDGVDDRLIRDLNAPGGVAGLPTNDLDRSVFLVARFHDAESLGGATYGRGAINQAYGVGVGGPGAEHGHLAIEGYAESANVYSVEDAFTSPGVSNGWMVLSVVHAKDGFNPAINNWFYRDGIEIAAWSQNYNTKINHVVDLNGATASRIVLGESIKEAGSIQMDVAAWIVYDQALNAQDRGAVEQYLSAKYMSTSSNQSPIASDDAVTISPGATAVIDILANDFDADGTIDPNRVTVVDFPSHMAEFSINLFTGEITYTHDGSVSEDVFTYHVLDNSGAVSNTANVRVFLTTPNQSPVATDDLVTINNGGTTTIDILANDLDTDGAIDPTSVTLVAAPEHATFFDIDPSTGVVSYTHNGLGSSDVFVYAVFDDDGAISNTATVTISLGDATNSLIVRWHGDYYQHLWDSNFPGGTDRDFLENRWLRGGPPTGSQHSIQNLDLDNDGQFDDSRVYFDFSLFEALNPRGTPQRPNGVFYHTDMPSAVFYGGLSVNYFNYETNRIQQVFIENDGAGGDLADVGYPSPYLTPEHQGMADYIESVRHPDGRYKKSHVGPHEDFAINIYRPELPHPIDESDDPADNLNTFFAAFIWKKEDFLTGGDSATVTLDANSSFSFESTRWWDNVGGARWILQGQGGQLYISEFQVAGAQDDWGHTNTFADPLSSNWAVYNPAVDDLQFDVTGATWIDPVSNNLFGNIQAVGVYVENSVPSGALTKFSLDEIRFSVVIGDSGGDSSPPKDQNASRHGPSDIVTHLSSSNQTPIGNGEQFFARRTRQWSRIDSGDVQTPLLGQGFVRERDGKTPSRVETPYEVAFQSLRGNAWRLALDLANLKFESDGEIGANSRIESPIRPNSTI